MTEQYLKQAYLTQEDSDAKRLRTLLVMYDAALKACVDGDVDNLDLALDLLQSKLNFDVWPSLGLVLYAQYNRCRELGRTGGFVEAGRVLATLRSAWTSGERRREAQRREAERMDGLKDLALSLAHAGA